MGDSVPGSGYHENRIRHAMITVMTRHRGHRARRPALALGVLLPALAGGCTLAPELAWQQADNVIVVRANDWLDLEPRQEQQLRQRLEPWLQDVRRQRLALYAEFLRELADRVTADIDLDDARRVSDRFEVLYRDTASSFLPIIAPTLATLSPEQQHHLANRIRERNDEYRADFIEGRDDGMYAIAERIMEAVERWTGALEPKQRAVVHEHVRELPRTAPQWFRYRRNMQQRLLAQIEEGAPVEAMERTLHHWWVERGADEFADSPRVKELREGLHRTLVELGRTLTAAQRAEARRRLHARAETLQTLADNSD